MITLLLDVGIRVVFARGVLVLRRHWLLCDDHSGVLTLGSIRTLTLRGAAPAPIWRAIHVQRGHDVHLVVLVQACF